MNGADVVLLAGLLKGMALAAVAAALVARADPAGRVWLLRGLGATLLLLPLLTVLGISSGLAVSFSLPALVEGLELPAAPALTLAEMTTPLPPPRPAWPWLLVTWLAGVLLAASGLLRQLLVLRRWHRQARIFGRRQVGGRRLQLAWSDAVTSPVSFGWRRPVVLLPDCWRGHPEITAQDLDHALAHEVAHVERGDWLWLMVSRLAGAVHWCNPLLPRLSRLLAEDTEIACDRRALGQVSDTAGYAGTLIKAMDVGRALRPGSHCRQEAGPALAMAGTAQWRRRIEHLYRRETPMTLFKTRLTLAAAMALPLTLIQLSHAETPAPQAAAPASDGAVAPQAALAPAVPEPVAPDTPVSPGSAPAAAPAPVAAPRAEASPTPQAPAVAQRAEAARLREQAQVMREAEKAEADRLRAQARAARDTQKAEARAARDAERARRDELRASRDEARVARDEVRRANQEALEERERLVRQLAELQARMAEIEAELAAEKARGSER